VNSLIRVSYFHSCCSQISTFVSSTLQRFDSATVIFLYGTDILVVIGYLRGMWRNANFWLSKFI